MNDLESLQQLKKRESLIQEEDKLRTIIENNLSENDILLDNLNLLSNQTPFSTLSSLVDYSFRNEYKLNNIIKTMDKSKPFLLITAGTSASGKSNFKRNTIDPLVSTIEISIDDIIENDDKYKEKILEIIIDNDLYLGPEPKLGLPGRLNNRDLLQNDEVIDKFHEAYFSVKKNVEHKRMNNLHKAIENRKNIIIETTGKGIPFKYLNQFKGYNIIFLYILVSNAELRNNNITRAENKILSFMRDVDANPAPRLPNVMNINIVKKNESMLYTLNEIRKICSDNFDQCNGIDDLKKEECKEICKNNEITLVVYNNDRRLRKPSLMYDHKQDKDFTEEYFNYIVNSILYPPKKNRVYKSVRTVKSLGGKKKKRTHKKKNKNKSKKNLKKLKIKNKSKKIK